VGNDLLYLKNILADRWQESVSGRQQDVPYPSDDRIKVQDKDRKTRHRANSDLLVLSKGTETKEPKGFGYTHRGRTATGTVQCKSSKGRERVFGTRDDNNDCEDYGGIAGEVERILDEVRKGHKEYDTLRAPEKTANSELEESGLWRCDVEFDLRIIAEVIDP